METEGLGLGERKDSIIPAIVTVCTSTNINFGDIIRTFRDGRILAPRACYPQLFILIG